MAMYYSDEKMSDEEFSRVREANLYNMGPIVIASVDKALMNLYNIKKW